MRSSQLRILVAIFAAAWLALGTATGQTVAPPLAPAFPPIMIPAIPILPAVATTLAPAQPVAPAAPITAPAPAPRAPAATSIADGTPLNDYWRNGLRFESADKSFSLFVGGRFQFDGVTYLTPRTLRDSVPGTSPLEEGVSFRRIRFDVGGTIYENIDFYAQVDFANGFLATPGSTRVTNATYPTDMWVTFKELPVVGNVRAGNQKPLYSFEHLTSSRFLTFLERSLGYDAFVEGFNNGFEPGITAFDTYLEKRGTWAVGLFKNTRSPFGWNVGRGEVEVNGRATFLPVYEDGGCQLVHVGVGAAHRDLDDDQARFRTRFDARSSPAPSPASSPTPACSSGAANKSSSRNWPRCGGRGHSRPRPTPVGWKGPSPRRPPAPRWPRRGPSSSGRPTRRWATS